MAKFNFNPLTGNFDLVQDLSETIALNSLSDVAITSATQYDHLEFDGSDWVNVADLTMAGDIIPSVDNTYDLGQSDAIFADIWGRNIYGGDATADSLNIYAHSSADPLNDAGEIVLRGRIADDGGSYSYTSASNLIDGVMRFTNDYTFTQSTVSIFPLIYDQRTLEFQAAQILSNASTFIANTTYQINHTGTDIAWTAYTGFISNPNLDFLNNSGTATVKNFGGFSSGTTVASTGTGAGQIDVVAQYNSYQNAQLGGIAIPAGVTATDFVHYNIGVSPTINGTVTNHIGLSIPNLTSATNVYGIRSAIAVGSGNYHLYLSGTGLSYFNGKVGIGTDDPDTALHIYQTGTTNNRLILEGARTTSTGQIFSIDFMNTDVSSYTAARIESYNENGLDAGNLIFSTTNGGSLGTRLTLTRVGILRTTNKVSFTQTDDNEYIDSEGDGRLDIAATTAIDFKIGGNQEMSLGANLLTFDEATNIATGTTTGTKIGTATTQKIGFWNATPIVQPTTGVAEATFTENSGGTVVNVDSTFGGYTLQQVVQALQNTGILA